MKTNQPTKWTIYTDGGCIGNPGPGGYGVVLLARGVRREMNGGYRLTTNNRMELLAAIQGLGALPGSAQVTLYSDSRYLVDGMNEGWVKEWSSNRWKKADKKKALNIDLWKALLELCDRHTVQFVWVAGHTGNRENERCHRLCMQAAARKTLPADLVYEQENSKQSALF